MGYLDRTRVHHCPGQNGKVDGFPGNCSRRKRGHCEVHQMLCEKHTNWAYMRSKICELCDQEAKAQLRALKNGQKIATAADSKRKDKDMPTKKDNRSENTPRKEKEAEQKKIDILAQHLEDVEQEKLSQGHPLPPMGFNERREKAAEILGERGWPALREALAESGVSESSLPSDSEEEGTESISSRSSSMG